MNYSALLRSLLNEAFEQKQYQLLTPAVRFLAFLGILPFFLVSFFCVVAFEVYTFSFKIFSASVNYLEEWLKEARRDVQHATEAVLYYVTIPFIFLMHVFLSFFAGAFFLMWFFLQCALYITTLGGIRWQPYINDATFKKEDDFVMTSSVTASITIASILFALGAISFLLGIASIDSSDLDEANTIFACLYYLFAVIAVPSVARKQSVNVSEYTADDEDDEDDDLELPEVRK